MNPKFGILRLAFAKIAHVYNASQVLALALALTAAVLSSAPSGAQQTGASRVALANVTDSRNKPLVDVSADDFVIQEAGTARDILSVRPADYPIAVLLDTGVEARADFPLMQKAVAHFIERIGQRPIALGTFGGVPADDHDASRTSGRRC